MGFLDKKSRVVDFVLTERGRRLYATGQLDFAYFVPFDDGIDYDPPVSTDEERLASIESTLVLEAPFIRETRGIRAGLEPVNCIFTASPNARSVPRLLVATGSMEITCNQARVDEGYIRFNTTEAALELSLAGDVEVGRQGFTVRMFSSGSNGIHEIGARRDLAGRRAFDPFVAIALDEPSDALAKGRR